MQRSLVKLLIQQKNNELKKRGKKFKRKVMPKGRSFKMLERVYFSEIKSILLPAKKIVEEILIPKLGWIIRQRDALRPTTDSNEQKMHFDSWVDEITEAMNNIKIQYEEVITIPKIEAAATQQAAKINRLNSTDFDKNFEKVLGVPPIKLNSWLSEEIKHFTKENVSLIKSIPETYFSQIESRVSRMVQQGKMTDDITSEIKTRYKVSESRAALIARDQTNKFNGSLTKLRQQEVGITKYEWSTSLDERVRPEHAEREGKIYNWDDPPEDGNPGEAINCRCTALAIFDIDEE